MVKQTESGVVGKATGLHSAILDVVPRMSQARCQYLAHLHLNFLISCKASMYSRVCAFQWGQWGGKPLEKSSK